MNEELFNMDLRKFLKRFGVGAQREIERAVAKGIESGALSGNEVIRVRARLEIDGLDGELLVEDDLHLA